MVLKSNKQALQPSEYFRLSDGYVIKDLSELQTVLKKMSSDVFNFHVNLEKNDFSNWIRDVFKDKTLAERLAKLNSKEEMSECIKKRAEERKVDAALNNILMIENAKRIMADLYPRKRIVSCLKRAYENV